MQRPKYLVNFFLILFFLFNLSVYSQKSTIELKYELIEKKNTELNKKIEELSEKTSKCNDLISQADRFISTANNIVSFSGYISILVSILLFFITIWGIHNYQKTKSDYEKELNDAKENLNKAKEEFNSYIKSPELIVQAIDKYNFDIISDLLDNHDEMNFKEGISRSYLLALDNRKKIALKLKSKLYDPDYQVFIELIYSNISIFLSDMEVVAKYLLLNHINNHSYPFLSRLLKDVNISKIPVDQVIAMIKPLSDSQLRNYILNTYISDATLLNSIHFFVSLSKLELIEFEKSLYLLERQILILNDIKIFNQMIDIVDNEIWKKELYYFALRVAGINLKIEICRSFFENKNFNEIFEALKVLDKKSLNAVWEKINPELNDGVLKQTIISLPDTLSIQVYSRLNSIISYDEIKKISFNFWSLLTSEDQIVAVIKVTNIQNDGIIKYFAEMYDSFLQGSDFKITFWNELKNKFNSSINELVENKFLMEHGDEIFNKKNFGIIKNENGRFFYKNSELNPRPYVPIFGGQIIMVLDHPILDKIIPISQITLYSE